LNNEKGINAFDYLAGLRLALISPNETVVAILFLLSLIKS